MIGHREINWARATSDARRRRLAEQPPVREERLRVGGNLVAWRRHSGKR